MEWKKILYLCYQSASRIVNRSRSACWKPFTVKAVVPLLLTQNQSQSTARDGVLILSLLEEHAYPGSSCLCERACILQRIVLSLIVLCNHHHPLLRCLSIVASASDKQGSALVGWTKSMIILCWAGFVNPSVTNIVTKLMLNKTRLIAINRCLHARTSAFQCKTPLTWLYPKCSALAVFMVGRFRLLTAPRKRTEVIFPECV